MKLYRQKDRANITSNIWEYQRRLKIVKERYNVKPGRHNDRAKLLLYFIESKKIKKSIRRWKRAIMAIDKRSNQVIAIGNHLCYFTGINVKGSAANMEERFRIARGIFYKYCLEHNIHGTVVSDYVGSHQNTAAKGRINFTNSFQKHPEKRELYNRFKLYMEDIESQGDN
jgi:hypothetical protein